MLDGNRCERCGRVVRKAKARYKQTKYCDDCARLKKRANTLSPWLPEEKQAYMRRYMRAYRKTHPGLSSPYVRRHRKNVRGIANDSQANLRLFAWFLPCLIFVLKFSGGLEPSFEAIRTLVTDLELLAVKFTGLVALMVICWRHIANLWTSR